MWEYLRDRWLSHRVLAGGYEAVVDAACAAWDDGRGVWPTMRVEERIEAVEEFVRRMKAVRETVVERMMW